MHRASFLISPDKSTPNYATLSTLFFFLDSTTSHSQFYTKLNKRGPGTLFLHLVSFPDFPLAHSTHLDLSRLNEYKDTVSLSILTLDFITHTYPNISRVDGLPYNCTSITACPTSYGGVIVQSPDCILHVDQGSRVVALPVNGWAKRVTSHPAIQSFDSKASSEENLRLELEGAHLSFVAEKSLLLFLANGVVYSVIVVVDGRSVSRLSIGDPIAQCVPPSVLRTIGSDHIFLGCTVGSSALLQTSWHQSEKQEEAPVQPQDLPADADMEIDEGS